MRHMHEHSLSIVKITWSRSFKYLIDAFPCPGFMVHHSSVQLTLLNHNSGILEITFQICLTFLLQPMKLFCHVKNEH